MHFLSLAMASCLVTVVSAHFQMQYPIPRGPFVEDDEPTFCDGYTNAVSNRTVFPLSNGVIQMNSEHPTWTVGVLVSTAANPTSFNDFNNATGGNQLVVGFFQTTGEGLACFNIDLASSSISGIQDGANVTIEVTFDGGDGKLYQCADLTLSSTATVPANATQSCNNITSQEPALGSSSNSTPSGSATAPASSKTAAAVELRAPFIIGGLTALVAMALAW